MHLFSTVRFNNSTHLAAWKRTFLVPSNSPAHYTHTLSIHCHFVVITDADPVENSWIPTFSRLVRLRLDSYLLSPDADLKSLIPFYTFSPTLKSLSMTSAFFPLSHLSDLIQSLPLLEDLNLVGQHTIAWGHSDRSHMINTPSTSPPFTGTLKLCIFGGMNGIANRLLDLPNGIHFRTLKLSWCQKEDFHHMVKLVRACSSVLENLYLTDHLKHGPTIDAIDLSRATKLKKIVFRCESPGSGWLTMALGTITPAHQDLQQISIYTPFLFGFTHAQDCAAIEKQIEETDPGVRWSDLDHLLVQLWESRSIRPRVLYPQLQTSGGRRSMKDWVVHLFPELAKRGIIDPEEA